MTATGQVDLVPIDAGMMFLDGTAFTDLPRLREAIAVLQAQAPVQYVNHPEYPPVWVMSKFAHIREIETHPEQFAQGPMCRHISYAKLRALAALPFPAPRLILMMDGAEHRDYRNVTAGWFTPRNLTRLMGERIPELAKQFVDRMAELGNTCDFAEVVAARFPLYVILSMLGLPESDYDFILKLAHEEAAGDDAGSSGEDILEIQQAFFDYFNKVSEDRRAHPTEDLSSVIANARLSTGEEMGTAETFGYLQVLAVAGHDTTYSTLGAGIAALAEFPDQLARLQADPSLLDTATEEIFRWATPVKHFTRTVVAPYTIAGHEFVPGDCVFLSYAAANLDPDRFPDPLSFDIGRPGGEHLAFGAGPHYCLGAQLARMEVRALLSELLPRLKSLELAGKVEYTPSFFLSGPKHIPIRYDLS